MTSYQHTMIGTSYLFIFWFDHIVNMWLNLQLCISSSPIMDHSLLLIGIKLLDVEGVYNPNFTVPNSAINFDCCNQIKAQVGILVEFQFPCISEEEFVPCLEHVVSILFLFLRIAFIDKIFFSFLYNHLVFIMTLTQD